MQPVIKVENLSKKFIIGHESKERYTTLRDQIANKTKKIFSFFNGSKGNKTIHTTEEFWALKDLSFEVNQGDRIGIIGRNGAGKSTLLKILSRITEPSSGKITLNGRVASLLEVGTGFHPELTGRENIYLNGAILGMSRVTIKKQFDAIVDFAEVEKFLDTPVKRYSSGMYVRLAFAVAAHLEPEILIVDEVLAVGDAQFQKKCLGKMEEVSDNDGRTVLFVSHNMNTIKSLCKTGILLHDGIIASTGSTHELVDRYLEGSLNLQASAYSHKMGGTKLRITKLEIGKERDAGIKILSEIKFEIKYEAKGHKGECEFFILIYSNDGICLQGIFQSDVQKYSNITSDQGVVKLTLTNILTPGRYLVSVGAFDRYRNFLDWVEYCETIEIESLFPDGRLFQDRLGLTLGNQTIWE